MTNNEIFQPNWVSAPGDTIIDIMEERELSTEDLAISLGLSSIITQKIIDGAEFITEELSVKLAKTLGASEDFWLRREFQYRESLVRLSKVEEISWLKLLPIKDMINFGWIQDSISRNVKSLLSYFGVSDIKEWYLKYEVEMAQVSFRTSSKFKQQPAAVAAWLRQGELQSKLISCQKWNPEHFRKALTEIKRLTKIKDPQIFLPILKQICAECGVAIAIVRTPNGCQASGVTKFLDQDTALLMLSFRYLKDDQFWFTFFHEAGHLLLHGKNSVFVEEVGKDRMISEEENEANEFAAEQLIPKSYHERMLKLPINNRKAIIGFASELGIAPGIVVGQLQHLGKVPFNRFNSYKRSYTWDTIPDFNH